ncbi:MAG: phosphoglycerate kinase [Candidatus Kaiserbacteria bacterium]|nr:phosphoglycerate kinase [Candidatus Kaiserbacteria bacterium]
MRNVRDIRLLENIPVLVRAAMNVPIKDGRIANEYRLRRALPTIRFLAERGARVILIGHIGEQGTETLAPVAEALGNMIPNVSFSEEIIGTRVRSAIRDLSPGHILVLENLRRNVGEQANDRAFARELAALGDVFVQDCFDTCHRAHASIVGIPEILPSYAGFLLEEEVRELTKALAPKHPALAVIGGAKFMTKEPVITKLLSIYDQVFVGGAIANDFLKASGKEVGKSFVSNTDTDTIKKILANPKLVLPIDSVIKNEKILDSGSGTKALLDDLAKNAKTIIWNGPLGNCENGFCDGTNAFAQAVANSNAHSIVGGGDTIAAIEDLGLLPKFSFVSTGGGAMLDFLAHCTLPGIKALN